MSDNLKLWNTVCETNPDHTKQVNFGRKITAIDPYRQIQAATKQFGPVGEGWGWNISQVTFLPTNEVAVLIEMWHSGSDRTFCQWGQNSLFIDAAENKKDKDCMKKATTDGITKCLSMLGFNADVFLGKFDDNKYVAEQRQKNKASAQIMDTEGALKEDKPVKGRIMGAKKKFKEVCGEIESCTDYDLLDQYLKSIGNTIEGMREVIPSYMDGGEDMPSFDDRINQQRIIISNAQIGDESE